MIFIICYLAYTSIYVARLNLSMASPELMDTRILDTAQVGMLGSIFSVIYAFGRLINGGFSDRRPPWQMICSGLLLAGISNIAIGFFPPFAGILLLWGANAYAQSMLWSSVLCIVSSMYDPQTAKRKTSFMVTSVATGNIVGILLNSFIISKIGVGYAFIIPGAITLIFATLILLTTREIEGTKTAEIARRHISLPQLLHNHEIRLALLPATLHGMMKDNISLWMAVYFVDKFGIDLEQSTYFVLLIPIVGFIGRMAYPLCYRLCKEQEHKVSVYAFIVCAAASVPLFLGTNLPVVAMICLSLIYAAVSLVNTSFLSIFPIRFISTGNVASVSGIMDFATYFGAGVSSVIYGFLIKKFGYSPMYFTWAVISVIALALLRVMMVKERNNEQV